MPAKVIRGLSIEIDGESRQLNAALAESKSKASDLKSEVNELKKSLKTDWNMDTFVRAQNAAKQEIAETEKRAEMLNRKIAELSGDSSEKAAEQVKYLQVQLINAQTAATKAKQHLSDIIGTDFTAKLKSADNQLKSTQNRLKALQDSLALKWDEQKFSTAQQLARDALTKTEEKAKLLREQLGRIESEGSTEHTQREFDELTAKLAETETAAQRAQKQLAEINQMKLDRITGIMDKIGNTMLRGGAVATAGITLPLVALGKQALETASDLVEVQNVVDTSFKASAETINQWSQNLLESVGMSELSAKQYAGLYKAMANGMEVADDAGTDMAQRLTELTGDLASFYNVKQDIAGTALKSIFTGETETLKQFGVVMTEANLNAYALSHGMEKMSTEMSQADKVALRYSFVMDSMTNVHGDFTRTIDSGANQVRLAQENFKALSADLAKEVLPVATDILKWANDQLKAFSQMSDEGKKTTLMILGLAAGMGPAVTLLGGMFKGVSGLISVGGKAVAKIREMKAATDAAATSQAALNAVSLSNPYLLLAAAVAAVGAASIVYANANNEVEKSAQRVTKALVETRDAYNDTARSAEESANTQLSELNLADQLISRYDALNGKVNKSAQERAELQNIVAQLNDLLGIEIKIINQEALQFDATAASLRNLTQARREDIKMVAMRDKAVAAQKAKDDTVDQLTTLDVEIQKAQKLINDYNSGEMTPWEAAQLKKNPWSATPLLSFQEDLDTKLKSRQKILDEIKSYDAQIEKYAGKPTIRNAPTEAEARAQAAAAAMAQNTALTTATASQTYDQAKAELDHRMSMDWETQQSYYDKLVALREQYFADESDQYQEQSEEYRRLMVEIHNQEKSMQKGAVSAVKSSTKEQTAAYKEMYNEQKQAVKDYYDNLKKYLKEEYDDRKAQLEQEYKDEVAAIEDGLKAKEKAINAEIKAIDKQIEARRRAKEEEEYTGKADSLRAQLAYGKLDDFSRRELESELQRVLDEEADYKWEREQEDRKDALNEELASAKEVAEQRKADLQEMLEINRIALENDYKQQLNFLETAYQVHLDELESMFTASSAQMDKISQSFVNTITEGCKKAASMLNSAVNRAENAASDLQNARATYIDNSQRSANVFASSGMTVQQVQRIAQGILYD